MTMVRVLTTAWFGLGAWALGGADDQEIKFSSCPPAVRKTFEAEAKGVKIETVTKEKDDGGDVVYWADATIDGANYAIGVLEDGTLSEMNLAVEDKELTLDRCPMPVQKTFEAEAPGAKVEKVGKDMKYGVAIYETTVEIKGKSYEISVAEDGTLVEKVLVIEDEEVELAACPAAVQAAFKDQAKGGGTIRDITRSGGIIRKTYEAEVEVKRKVYLIELSETGQLISKSLEAAAD